MILSLALYLLISLIFGGGGPLSFYMYGQTNVKGNAKKVTNSRIISYAGNYILELLFISCVQIFFYKK